MVEKGHSRDQAETEIGVLLTLLSAFNQAKLEVGSQQGQLRATLKITLDLSAVSKASGQLSSACAGATVRSTES